MPESGAKLSAMRNTAAAAIRVRFLFCSDDRFERPSINFTLPFENFYGFLMGILKSTDDKDGIFFNRIYLKKAVCDIILVIIVTKG